MIRTLTQKQTYTLTQIFGALATLGLMWLLPFLAHLLPPYGKITMGMVLLPLYYAPLLAVFLFHPGVALVSGILMPFINHYAMGMPTLPLAAMLALELSVFSVVLLWWRGKTTATYLIAPTAVLLGKAISALLLVFLPILPSSPWVYFRTSVSQGLIGLLVIAFLGYLFNRMTDVG